MEQQPQARGPWPDRLVKASLSKGVSRGSKASRDYTPEQRRQLLKRAVQDVLTYGISVRLAAESHGVAKSSLSDYIRKHNINVPKRNSGAPASLPDSRASPEAASPGSDSQMNAQPLLQEQLLQQQQQQQQQQQHPHQHQHLLLQHTLPQALSQQAGLAAWSFAGLPTLVPWQPLWRALDVAGDSAVDLADTADDSGTEGDVSSEPDLSQQLCNFINRSPSPLHAVAEVKRMLLESGYVEVSESDSWQLRPNDRCFFTRDGVTLVAMAAGGRWRHGNGLSVVAASTESPCLRLRSSTNHSAGGACGAALCSVQGRGSASWNTWLDRDLTAAGSVVVRRDSGLSEQLVHLSSPILKVPSVSLDANLPSNELPAILCELMSESANQKASRTHAGLIGRVAEQAGCPAAAVAAWELWLTDTQPAQQVGLHCDFVSGPRLSSQLSCFACLSALLSAGGQQDDTQCRVLCLSDKVPQAVDALARRLSVQGQSLVLCVDACEASRGGGGLFDQAGVRADCRQRSAAVLRQCMRMQDSAAELPEFPAAGTCDSAQLLPTLHICVPVLGSGSCRATVASAAPAGCVRLLTAFLLHFSSALADFCCA